MLGCIAGKASGKVGERWWCRTYTNQGQFSTKIGDIINDCIAVLHLKDYLFLS